MNDVLHSTYSPSFPNALTIACECAEKDGFALQRVIVVSPYEAVAVFERPSESPKGDQ